MGRSQDKTEVGKAKAARGRQGTASEAATSARPSAQPVEAPELILSEKFAPAALPDVCAPRLRVVDALDRAVRQRRFVYVGAPAGSGKTVSALLWLKHAKRPCVWIGLDRYDDVPSVFYKQLAMGLYSVQPDNAGMRTVLESPAFSASPVEHTVRLVAEMRPLRRRFVLVIDDMHLIENREIVKSLPAVLRRLPGAFAVLLLSRAPLPGEWRALGGAEGPAVMGADDLRFAPDEIRGYFNALGRFPTPDEARLVHAATEGWAIGVAALAKSDQVAKGDGRTLFASYFERQVWSAWDEGLRAFCLATSVAEEFDPALAALLSGRDDARDVMEQLARTNTFLSRLHGDTYRYHHLFRDFLRDKAAEAGVDRAALCKRAAESFRAGGDYTRALRFWFESGDFRGMDTYLLLFLFENAHGSVADYADFLRTLGIEALPDEAFRVCPPLRVLAAWFFYLTSQRAAFERHLDELYRALPRIAVSDTRFVEFALLAYSVDHRTTIIEKARRFSLFGRFVKRFTPAGLATKIASFTHNLPYPHRSNVDYSAIALEDGGFDLLGRTFRPLLGAEWCYIPRLIESCFAYERNRLDEALAGFEAAAAALVPENQVDGRVCIMVMRHATLWQQGRDAEAACALDDLAAFTQVEAAHFLPNLKAYRAKLALFDADARTARAWMEEYFVTGAERIELVRVFQHFTTARALIVLGRAEEAERLLGALLEFGRGFNRPLDVGEAGTLLAALRWALGRKDEAVEALAEALEVLAPYGFFRAAADEGAAVEPVLKSLADRLACPGYKGCLERGFVQEALLAAHERGRRFRGVCANLGARRADKPVKLSKQQKRVLELLARGLRNAEIAAECGLSVPTVKSHIAAAYQKLGVHNAMDAILRARDLGLLE
ncbi:LuxR C-terminal-related transcriptional regulator [Arabiibacter massiliensis]|uniref:LuxR C-terminal-related transcriptional regulator n=1 Tax=Arabiibacter massiliensis TaxID=1870985 RepID=UPI0009BC14A4|nr:LuxR C-terminal-related transcriptional regulator [Arabiibacter massiliensis]